MTRDAGEGASRRHPRESADARDFEYLTLPLPDEPDPRPTSPPGTDTAMSVYGVLVTPMAFVVVFAMRRATWKLETAAAVGVLVFLFSFRGGPAGWWRKWRRATASTAGTFEPWRSDHSWDPTGVSVTPLARLLRGSRRWDPARGFGVAVLYTLAGVAVGGLSWPLFAGLGGVSCLFAWKWWRVQGAGTTRVSFAKFPFHPGETVTLYVGTSDGGASYRRAQFHLRHVQEISGGFFETLRIAHVTQQETVDRPPGLLPGPGQDVEIAFDLPPNAPPTRLSGRPRSYWVLDIVANTSSGPYCESALIPIYERPGKP